VILKPRTGNNREDTAWHNKAEFFSVLKRFGLKPTAPDFAAKTDMRRHKWTEKTAVKAAGLAFVATVAWTLTYDNLSKGVLEAKRETYITDTVTDAEYIIATVVFLTTTGGSTTWTKDATWNNFLNKVEIVGTAASGLPGVSGKFPTSGLGAGGGAYTYKDNVVLSGNPSYQIGAGNTNTPLDAWFVSATEVLAKSSTRPGGNSNSVGGAAASCIPSANAFSGGTANSASGSGGHRSGGGAAGPSGAGGNTTAAVGAGSGGTANGGTVAADVAGTNWDATHGSGGGASRLNASEAGRNGPLYGGGPTGGAPSGGAAGNGGQGLIVLTWTPASGGTHRFFSLLT
jgi:hypothetical protein